MHAHRRRFQAHRSLFALVFLLVFGGWSTEYYVAVTGLDSNPGTSGSPFKTIGKAAAVMQAGDTCTVHAGTYREWVVPPRSGTSDAKRIVYRAAPGETVKIKGSEQITTWVNQGNNVWTATIDSSFFHGYNPYAKTMDWDNTASDYMTTGQWHHRGDVYLNETALYEQQSLSAVQTTANSWYCSVSGATTSISANFGAANPNTSLAEINVRQSVIWPNQMGIAYITIDGFTVMHSAESWTGASGGNGVPQWGAIGPDWGLAWIIQNCRVKNARCIGICLGNEPGSVSNFSSWGHHIVRNCWISNCGEAGISGERGEVASVVENNLIEDINDRQEFGGYEGGGIKFHFVADVLVSGNCIRRIHGTGGNGNAMWLDWTCQNTRVTGNLMYSCDSPLLNLEVFHGPVLFDNNVFIGDVTNQIQNWSSNICYVNNLFYNISMGGGAAGGRTSYTFAPHSLNPTGETEPGCAGWRVYNNIFAIGSNTCYSDPTIDRFCDYNAYLQGSAKAQDVHGIQDASNFSFVKQEGNGQVTISFSLPSAAQALGCPQATQSYLGTFKETNVMLTHPDDSPLNVDQDYFGKAIPLTGGRVGPFQDAAQGGNTYVLWPKAGTATALQSSPAIVTTTPALSVSSGMIKTRSGERGELSIIDLRGAVAMRRSFDGATEFSLVHLPAGIYIATMKTSADVAVARFCR